ncbi:MAG: hypothetical protein FWC70_12970 [Defluviitaleaceae bacterium]|nr:hypothetical protein [Defluviitaleaceae bacterium]
MSKNETPDRKEYQARYYAERKAELSAQRKAKRLARRDEVNAANRERYATDADVRAARRRSISKYTEKIKALRPTDEELQKRHQESLARRRARYKERLENDPAFREMLEVKKANQREKRRKKREEAST